MSELSSERVQSSDQNKKTENQAPQREQWQNRVAFILACIGSAVGIGNFWRFPYLTYKHGGAVFFLPYLMALFLFGIPMLLFELGVGQKFRKGDIGVFGGIHRRIYGIGMCSVYASFVILGYYLVIISWAVYYFFASFVGLYWSEDSEYAGKCKDASAAETFFYMEVLKVQGPDCKFQDPSKVERFAPLVLLCTIICWVICFLATFKGTKSMSQIVYFTVPLPVILLLIMLFRVVFLPGAMDGIKEYLWAEGDDKFEPYGNGLIWSEAIGQIFFSIGVCFGVMTSYGSYQKPNDPIVANSLIISLTNSAISFFSGFVVWSVIGYLRHIDSKVSGKVSSIGLAFIAYPTATTKMEVSLFWALLLFAVIFLLGIDSAFSLLEAMSTVIHDQIGHKVNRPIITLVLCIIGGLTSAIYCMDIGLYLFDVIDHYLNSYVMLNVGILQCVGVSYFYQTSDLFHAIGKRAAFISSIGYWVSCIIGVILGFHVFKHYEWIGLIIQLILTIIFYLISYVSAKNEKQVTFSFWLNEIAFAGVRGICDNILRLSFQKNVDSKPVGGWQKTWSGFFKWWWCLSIKFFIPTSLLWIVWWALKIDVENGYGEYPAWYGWFGLLFVFIGGLLVIVPAFIPYSEPNWEKRSYDKSQQVKQ